MRPHQRSPITVLVLICVVLSGCAPVFLGSANISDPPVITAPATVSIRQGDAVNVRFIVVNATSCTWSSNSVFATLLQQPIQIDAAHHTASFQLQTTGAPIGTYAIRLSCVSKTGDSAHADFDVVITLE
jgi:hypothetical protein